jgi:hypothetical protein
MKRLAAVFGGQGGEPYATAEEWVREACEARYGADLPNLHRTRRALALQKTVGTLLALEDEGELVFTIGLRAIVAEKFARFWDGVVLNGPPWRLDPREEDRPLYRTFSGVSSDFGGE